MRQSRHRVAGAELEAAETELLRARGTLPERIAERKELSTAEKSRRRPSWMLVVSKGRQSLERLQAALATLGTEHRVDTGEFLG